MLGRRLPVLMLVLISLAALGYAATLRVAESKTNGTHTGIFWSDEAVYHSMAYSFAFDGDIRYESKDLERVYAAGYSGGPSGIFLVRNPANGHLYYSKAWIYPLVAAPFVRLFGDNGFFILHALLLATMLAAGYTYARRGSASAVASLFTVTYVLGSVVTLYFFWMTPEWFNCTLMFLATFLWLYKETPNASRGGRWSSLLEGAWTDYAAALVYGLAIFSKPPNILLIAPLLLWNLWRRRWGRSIACGTVCAGVILAMFAVTWAWIGSPNYQGGDRRQFNVNTSYPLFSPDQTFASIGIDMTTNLSDFAAALPPFDTWARDLVYVWIGRNGGMVLYMFPAVLALGLFLVRSRWRLMSPRGLLAVFWLLEILAIVLYVRGNWIGGGGTVGSRYFANVYPVLFFILPTGTRLAASAASWVVWGMCLAQIVLSPVTASLRPAAHTTHLPYTLFPVELTILHNLPFNTNPWAHRQTLTRPARFHVYFLDDNTYLSEPEVGGFWVKGGRDAEVVLRTAAPAERITLSIRNRTRANRVIVRFGSQVVERLIEPRGAIELTLEVDEQQRYIEGPSWLYRFSIWSEQGTLPIFDTAGSGDIRNLGVLVRPSLEPDLPLMR